MADMECNIQERDCIQTVENSILKLIAHQDLDTGRKVSDYILDEWQYAQTDFPEEKLHYLPVLEHFFFENSPLVFAALRTKYNFSEFGQEPYDHPYFTAALNTISLEHRSPLAQYRNYRSDVLGLLFEYYSGDVPSVVWHNRDITEKYMDQVAYFFADQLVIFGESHKMSEWLREENSPEAARFSLKVLDSIVTHRSVKEELLFETVQLYSKVSSILNDDIDDQMLSRIREHAKNSITSPESGAQYACGIWQNSTLLGYQEYIDFFSLVDGEFETNRQESHIAIRGKPSLAMCQLSRREIVRTVTYTEIGGSSDGECHEVRVSSNLAIIEIATGNVLVENSLDAETNGESCPIRFTSSSSEIEIVVQETPDETKNEWFDEKLAGLQYL